MIRHPHRTAFSRPATQTGTTFTGGVYQLGGGTAGNTVNDARNRLQEHYNLEAQVAAEKLKEKERKKKLEWLERQERLVKPGHVLGAGNASTAEVKDASDYQNCSREAVAALPTFSAADEGSAVERDHRREMAAARARFQERYNHAIQQKKAHVSDEK